MSLDVEPLVGEGSKILPGQRAAAAEEVGVDEQCGAEAVVLQDRAGVLGERLVPVVEREQDGLARQLAASCREREEIGETQSLEPVSVKLAHLGVERTRG